MRNPVALPRSSASAHVEVIAKCIAEGGDDDRILLSLRLKDGRVCSGIQVYGCQQGFRESMPFIIEPNGQIDFGTAYDLQQFGETDLYQVLIELGSKVSWSAHGADDTFEVESIIPVD
jgi:hypothetical protein